MNTKWKIILILMLLIICISGVFILIFVSNNQSNLTKIVDTEISGIKAVVKSIEEDNNRFYRNRIKSFVSYDVVPKRKEIVAAFARKDRNELLRLSAPYLKIFKQENPCFSTFGWITRDNHNFLRVHNPGVFGDNIEQMRPDIVEANNKQQPNNGYTVARRGLEYRFVQPVFYKEEYAGVVQFGIKTTPFLDIIHSQLKHPVGIAIPNKIYSSITLSKSPSLAGATHTIQSSELNLFQQDFGKIDWNLDRQRVILQEKAFLIIKVFSLLNYRQESQGHLFVALDISENEKQQQSGIILILSLSSVLILISFIILYFSYSSLTQKIMDLNKALEQSNDNLENQVENRTTQLRESEGKYRLLAESMNDVIVQLSPAGELLYVSPNIKKFGGYDPEIEIGNNMSKYFENDADIIRAVELIEKVLETHQNGSFEFLFKPKGKKPFPVEHTYFPIVKNNKVTAIQLVLRDITERKQAEEQIAASLNEKVVLLKEIHHRVKNNMQVIVSLLRMHGRRIKDKKLGKVFEECRDRINAMSLIHESLYQSDDLSRIDFKVYLKKLCRNLSQVYGASGEGVVLTVKECDVRLGMDQGIAIGMVITELISNSFKYAFPPGKGGTVEINLSELDEKNVQLIISDNGSGLPKEIDIMNPPSLGLQLAVSAVTLELGGSIEVERNKGTRFTICFKYKENDE